MSGVYSGRRLVLVVALAVALLTNPLLGAALQPGSSEIPPAATSSNAPTTVDIGLTETATPATTTATTTTATQTSGATTDGDFGDVVSEVSGVLTTVVDANGTVTTVVNETNETVDDVNETLGGANETLANATGAIENASDDVAGTVENANSTFEESGTALENETAHADDTTVNVTVENASAGETVEVDVPSTGADVAFDDLAVEVERDGGFDLAFTSSTASFAGPPLDGQPGTVPLGYVRIDHTIENAEVGSVTATFSVDALGLEEADIDPANVALYRYTDGTWNELPTDFLGQEDGRYVFAADSPGLSEFAAGAKRPSFEVPTATVATDVVAVGDDVAIRVRVENRGGADGIYTANISFDGEVVATREVSVAAGGTRVVTFQQAVDSPGTYAVSINEVRAGDVFVRSGGTAGGPTTADEDSVRTSGQPGFGPLIALAAFVVVLARLLRKE